MEKEIKVIITEEDIDKNNIAYFENNEKENNENREFYVYEHIRLDNMTCFYIGKGKGERAYELERNDHHDNISNMCGHAVLIIKDNLTEEEAFELERDTIEDYVFNLGYGIDIKGYDDYDHKLPHLTNRTWGGEGISGKHHSKETKRMMSESMKGKNHPFYGKHHSEETKMKMSETKNKKVICVTTGKIFNSQKEASNYYKCSHIYNCCKGELKSAGKLPDGIPLQWKYVKDYNNDFKGILINPITE